MDAAAREVAVMPPWRFCVAPMMDRTDRHFRALFRRISAHALLYTPMIAATAVIRDAGRPWLGEGAKGGPIALQLGGDDPRTLARAAAIAQDAGYAEVDLNCGCPSADAARARWGAALMDHPALVGECVAAMVAACSIPVTVKHRLGITGRDDPERLLAFVDTVTAAGAARVTVHARAAVLGCTCTAGAGRTPPLRPEAVAMIVAARPGLVVVDNGGIGDLEAVRVRWRSVGPRGGVMVGRAAYDAPYAWIDIDRLAWADATPRPSRAEVVADVLARAARHAAAGGRPHAVIRHALGMWHGLPGARRARADALAWAGSANDAARIVAAVGLAERNQPAPRNRGEATPSCPANQGITQPSTGPRGHPSEPPS